MRSEIGVCSWSFDNAAPEDLARACQEAGVCVLQLGLQRFLSGSWQAEEAMSVLHRAGLRAVSGMMTTLGEDYTTVASIRETGGVRGDAAWPANLELAERAAELAERLELGLVTCTPGTCRQW
ncbi:MAG: hypothetical protein H0T97_13200 [Actinobacteria bacterium]|nr:hypothetical protein [Actinomycetota bacterium]